MLVDGSETPLTTLSQEIARPFGGTAGLLLPVFVTSGNFALVFDGYLAPLQGSDLDRQTGALLLGEVEVRATRDEIDPELQVVHARCEAKAFRADRSFAFIAFEATGEGVEYRLDKAREEAMQAMKAQLVEQVRKLMDSP